MPVRKSDENEWDEAQLRQAIQGYYAHISALDFEFGRLMNQLRRTNQESRTIVVYTSDHGDMLGSHGWRDKQLPHDESIRVPLIIGWPELGVSGQREQLIGLVDLAPTLLGAADLSIPESMDGQDLSATLGDEQASGCREIYISDYTACHQAFDRGTPAWRGIRTQDALYAKTCDGEPWFYFDLQEDPYQLKNLIEDTRYEKMATQLSETLDGHVSKHDAYLSPDILIPQRGLLDSWNESQREFDLPEIEAKGLESLKWFI